MTLPVEHVPTLADIGCRGLVALVVSLNEDETVRSLRDELRKLRVRNNELQRYVERLEGFFEIRAEGRPDRSRPSSCPSPSPS